MSMLSDCHLWVTGNKLCSHPSRKCCHPSRQNVRLGLLLGAVGAGIILGIILRQIHPFNQPKLNPRPLQYLMVPGTLQIRASTFLALPLILCSLISGLTSLGTETSGKVGMRCMAYYVCTTIIAVTEGFLLMYAIKPGATVPLEDVKDTGHKHVNNIDRLLDMIRNIFPDNMIEACFSLTKTDVTFKEVVIGNDTNNTVLVEEFMESRQRGINILGLTLFVIIFSMLLSRSKERAKPILDAVDVLFEVFMNFLQLLLWVFPVGITCVIAVTVIKMEDPVAQLVQATYFILTVLLGLLLHSFITLPLVYFIFLRKNPFTHMKACGQAFLTAFATANSNATLPVTMDCLEKQGINPGIIKAVCPIGATLNMDGFALYEAMAVLFVALLRDMNPGIVDMLITGLTAVVLSIGAPTVGGGFVLFLILFESMGLPRQDIFLLLPFDWILTRFRTAVNVWGDCVGAPVVESLSKKELEPRNLEMGTLNYGKDEEPIHLNSARRGACPLAKSDEDGEIVVIID